MILRIKAHIGVDSRRKLIHSAEATAANVYGSRVLKKSLHRKERRVSGGFGVRGGRRRCWPRPTLKRETGLSERRAIVIGNSTTGTVPVTATSPEFEPSWSPSPAF